MKIDIVTEAGKDVGLGHISRCQALGRAFQEKGMKTRFLVNGDESVSGLLPGSDDSVFNWLEERERLFSLTRNADIIVIDSYLADGELYRSLSSGTGHSVFIDDNDRLAYPSGMVVNGNIYAQSLAYQQRPDLKYLLGPRYFCIRSAFRRVAVKKIGREVHSLMVTLGGADPYDMMPGMIDRMQREFRNLFIHAVIGPGFRNLDAIEAVCGANTRLHVAPDADGMRDMMLEADMAVSSGGQTLYELARTGIPTIALTMAENQKLNVEGWAKAGFVEPGGDHKDPALLANICRAIRKLSAARLRRGMSSMGKKAVDGKGPLRVVDAILREMANG